jgi:ketosteroid isomerase-like protein
MICGFGRDWAFRYCQEESMKGASDNGGVFVASGLVLLLLFSIGGVAFFFAVSRQQRLLAIEAERAHLAEVQTTLAAQRGREPAEDAVPERKASSEMGFSIDQSKSIRRAVEAILRAQEVAWNAGNLDAFMEHYWKSEALTFSSGGKTTRGWHETLTRYRERYPTPEKMGRLKLNGLEITPLGNSAALVLGQWSLERESEPLSGNFSLLVRKLEGRWLIIHDHTSRAMD